MVESFEYGVPPAGWIKTNLQGGSGWYQLPIGIAPLPGWGNGTSSVPATAYAGTRNAYCTWSTGGSASEGYHSDQWLISPRMTGLTATSTVSYWLRFNFTNYPDEVRFRVSTNGPAPANFTFVPLTNVFAKASYTNQFPPWSNHVVNVGALGIPAGTPIWIAIQEYVWDNTWNGAAIQLDVIASDLAVPPQPRVGPTSLTFTAYYEGANPAAQTFAIQSVGSSGMSFSSQPTFGAGPTNWLTVGGPSTGTLPLQQSQTYTAAVSVAGLDLGMYVATNVFNVPGATNSPLRVPITLNVIRRPQTIAFPNPGPQTTTNRLGLAGTASSGLPVTFSVFSGPGIVAGATNLSFTGTGTVRVVAWQLGNVYYDVAPCVTQAMAVTKPNAAIAISNLSHVYDGAPHGATVTTVPAGLVVDTTYNGGAALPVAIGSYAVTSVVNDAMYGGIATATFTITRMVQTVDFPDPGAQWTTSVVGLAATASSGLPVTFSVASGLGTITGGTNLSFTGAGMVDVVATQAGDAGWLPAAATNSIAVSKVAAAVTLGSLSQTYDGAPKSATATTVPPGLAVDFTYAGSATAPTAVGGYAVTGTVNDAMYEGSARGTLTIGKGTAPVTLESLDQAYDGMPRHATATTDPVGLAVDFTYDGATNGPTEIGSYAVTGTVNEANWQGSATGTLTIGKGTATVTLEGLDQAYDGTSRHATATTVPAGLAVDFTYDGATNGPTEDGSYAVTGTVNAAKWQGSATGTQTIVKGTATVTLDALAQTYDGTPKSATATTVPGGLAVELTYDGSGSAPTAAGSYAVTGTVNAANWQGTNAGTLVIGKATQTIVDFLPPDGTWFPLGATTTLSAQASSGLMPVSFSNLAPEIAVLAGNEVTFTNRGRARVQARQAGDANWNEVAVTHEWRIGGLVTNVAPGAANVGGGIEILLQGQGLGDGTDIAGVTLAGVAATILEQGADEVRVRAAAAAGTITGDVEVVSASGGVSVGENAFEYLWLDPPEQLDPAEVRTTSFLARWRTVPAATTHLLDVGVDTNFSAYLPGYSARDVGATETHRVAGLARGTGYATRLFAWNAAGFSWPSRTAWTFTSLATPGDFDGDGVADPLVFQPATGAWDMESSTGTAAWLTPWGGRTMLPVPADYDGDGTDDFAL
ncbi:MAG: MBG domain-containing protein, partial [Kiritimatiellia bacterium]